MLQNLTITFVNSNGLITISVIKCLCLLFLPVFQLFNKHCLYLFYRLIYFSAMSRVVTMKHNCVSLRNESGKPNVSLHRWHFSKSLVEDIQVALYPYSH